ncbi:MAG: hypothetical protein KIH63_002385 [Candidatus Saccharibacteria bacterium]|nr:hypothetical protein [Candidatus Saccharibacteria bacterium]
MAERNKPGLGGFLAQTGVAAALILCAHELDLFPFQDQDPSDTPIDADFAFDNPSPSPETAQAYKLLIIDEFQEVAQYWSERGIAPEVSLNTDHEASTDNTCNTEGIVGIGPYYCYLNSTVYFSPEDLYKYERITGTEPELLAELIAGHEYGHAVQQSAQVPASDFELDKMARELQADCLAAAAMTEHVANDKRVAERAIRELGDPFAWLHDHGTGTERATAFREGLDGECPPIDDMLSAVLHAINAASPRK